jgi:hypothetical protein
VGPVKFRSEANQQWGLSQGINPALVEQLFAEWFGCRYFNQEKTHMIAFATVIETPVQTPAAAAMARRVEKRRDTIAYGTAVRVEQALLERAHPDADERILHRHGMCDGRCVRTFNGFGVE